jgi:hypothetical protein
MEWLSLPNVLQLIVGLGLLNVWLVRRDSTTAYRGVSPAHCFALPPRLWTLRKRRS